MTLFCDNCKEVKKFHWQKNHFNMRRRNDKFYKADCGCGIYLNRENWSSLHEEMWMISDLKTYFKFDVKDISRELIETKLIIKRIKNYTNIKTHEHYTIKRRFIKGL